MRRRDFISFLSGVAACGACGTGGNFSSALRSQFQTCSKIDTPFELKLLIGYDQLKASATFAQLKTLNSWEAG